MAEEPRKSRPNDNDVEIMRIMERHRTTRFITSGVVIVLLALIISVTYVTVMKPPWLVLVLALLAPAGLLSILIRVHLDYIKKEHRRTERLERQVNPDRTSSKSNARLTENSDSDRGQQ